MDRSERIGLGVSASAHLLVVAAVSLGLMQWQKPKLLAPPSIEVALADNIALESRTTAQATPVAAEAPEQGPVEPDVAEPAPPSPAVAKPEPKPSPVAKPTPAPDKAVSADQRRADLLRATAGKPGTGAKPPRAQKLGDDFLKGLDAPASKTPTAAAPGADAPLSATAVRALNAEISRQLKPYWVPPSGADADKLVTKLAVELGPDGALIGNPRVVGQSGVTVSNAGQKQLHAENAVRAVRRASPFKLPPDLYDAWHSLEINFDYRLSR